MPFLTQGKTNWKYILILLILTVIVGGGILWWIWNNVFVEKPLSICGPSGKYYWINISNCDKSCLTAEDCKFTCGCGAINKRETCHTQGITYDCVDKEVKCENNICVVGEEKAKDETANWKIYRNEEYGFEVKYPKGKDWKISETSLPFGFHFRFGPEGCIWISVIENPENLSVEKFYEEVYKNLTEEECKTADNFCNCLRYKKNFSRTNIAGKEAIRCEIVPGPLASTVILVSHDNFIYQISKIYTDYEGYEGPCRSLNTNKIFNQMLSTFRFLK